MHTHKAINVYLKSKQLLFFMICGDICGDQLTFYGWSEVFVDSSEPLVFYGVVGLEADPEEAWGRLYDGRVYLAAVLAHEGRVPEWSVS